MAKKLSKIVNVFDEYCVLAIVSNLKDYMLCYNINNNIKTDMVKHSDLIFVSQSGSHNMYSWYYYYNTKNHATYYLVGNKTEGSILLPSQKHIDYFLIIKDIINGDATRAVANNIRKIPSVTAVFDLSMKSIPGMELLFEEIELHELEHIKKS